MTKIERLIKNLPQGIDAGIITSYPNRLYFLGFNSSAGTLVVTREKAYFIIDFRYIEMAKRTIKNAEVILQDNLQDQIKTIINKHNIKEIAVENSYLTLKSYEALEKQCAPANITRCDQFDKLILDMRCIKDESEVAKMKQAQKITDETFSYILTKLGEGKTEREIALDMEFFLRKNGSEGIAFDFIVLSGTNGSTPHGVPGNNPIKNGTFITMDFGAVIDGYRSDMTRTVAVGQVTDKMRFVYDTVLKAQLESLKAIQVGKKCSEIDKVSRDIIYGAGFEGKYGHGLGHSVGVEIHEDPRFSPICDEIIRSGIVMTVEPGIYLEGEFGIRIEDMGQVTENGFDNFTKSPKELIIV